MCSNCKAGGGMTDSLVDGVCQYHCSTLGYCGNSDAYKTAGSSDCTPRTVPHPLPAACSTCKAGGGMTNSLVDGVCQFHCSTGGYCGWTDAYKTAGSTDCTLNTVPVQDPVYQLLADSYLAFKGIGYGAAHLINPNGDGKNFIWTDADDNKRIFTPDRNELGETQGFFISDLTNNGPLVNYLP